MPSSSALSSLAGKLCKVASPSPLPLSSGSCRCFSVQAKSKKVPKAELKTTTEPEPEPEPKPKPEPRGGAQILYRVSSSLAPILQTSETTRPDALKRVWDYIKAHKLQSSTEKSQILCDPPLKKAFGRDNVKVSEVLKYLSPHLSRKI
ncbi:hypothetical protein GOP47_0023043 [Adiantum capillus-veneris]|uniref:DM2 domain-containing protein n=1 Tax=Adiantum capillus-veneris TaxID=13818 RepID=A0A9D4U8I1_ADICA|nr:hypothetical protein GOP47_0023043 [Adiantum capillus-veneris]